MPINVFIGEQVEHKKLLYSYIAQGYKDTEVVELLKQRHDIKVHRQTVYYHKIHHEDEIVRIREHLDREILKLPVASKFYRLKIIQEVIEDILHHLWHEEPMFNRKGEVVGTRKKGNHKLLLEAVREAKNQIEENNGGELGMRKPLELMSREEKLNYTFTGDPSDDSWRRNPRFGQWVEVEAVEG
jgi:hypothetical protein